MVETDTKDSDNPRFRDFPDLEQYNLRTRALRMKDGASTEVRSRVLPGGQKLILSSVSPTLTQAEF